MPDGIAPCEDTCGVLEVSEGLGSICAPKEQIHHRPGEELGCHESEVEHH